jgi:hypothetical protein
MGIFNTYSDKTTSKASDNGVTFYYDQAVPYDLTPEGEVVLDAEDDD